MQRKTWVYEVNMWRSPILIWTILKVMLLSAAVPIGLVVGLTLAEQGVSESLRVVKNMVPIFILILLGLLLVAYVMVAIVNGGKYMVVFEMDDEKVIHRQIEKQFKKQQVIAMITTMAGALAGNPTVAGSGLLAATKVTQVSEFKKVRKVIVRKRYHVIYLNGPFGRNQVYANSQDFDEILNQIITSCKKAKVKVR